MAFTGIPEVDLKILSQLDLHSLMDACSASKYLQDLCQVQSLWRELLQRDFPLALIYLPAEMSLREWYFYLSMHDAASEGQLNMLLYLAKKHEYPTNIGFNQAIVNGHLPVVQWYMRLTTDPPARIDIYNIASSIGYIVLEDAIIKAAEKGHLSMIQYFDELTDDGDLLFRLLDPALRKHQFEIADYVHQQTAGLDTVDPDDYENDPLVMKYFSEIIW